MREKKPISDEQYSLNPEPGSPAFDRVEKHATSLVAIFTPYAANGFQVTLSEDTVHDMMSGRTGIEEDRESISERQLTKALNGFADARKSLGMGYRLSPQ